MALRVRCSAGPKRARMGRSGHAREPGAWAVLQVRPGDVGRGSGGVLSAGRVAVGLVGIVVTVLLNLSWVALVGLAVLTVAVLAGRGVIALLGG